MLCNNIEYLIIAIICIIFAIILKIILNINLKQAKKIGENARLDEATKKYPNNIEICKKYLEKLKNKNVNIKQTESKETSLYIAISDTIYIADIKDTYTRIQTIAHECLHSIQDRKILLFNFIYSNIYVIYFLITSILAIFKILPQKGMFLSILILMGLVYYVIRVYLENDAMIKAKYLAKEYMEEEKISTQEEINEIVEQYEELNHVGIKCINFSLFMNIIVKIIIFSIICYIR